MENNVSDKMINSCKMTDLAVEEMLTTERPIHRIILHCTADKEGVDNTVEKIRKYHVEHNKWEDIGYHYVVYRDGSIHVGRPVRKVGAHCVDGNNNQGSIGISYVGGLDTKGKAKDTRTPGQKEAFYRLVHDLLLIYPTSDVRCHNEFANKACPSFQIGTFLDEYDQWKAEHPDPLPAEEPEEPVAEVAEESVVENTNDTVDNNVKQDVANEEQGASFFEKLLSFLKSLFQPKAK